MQTRIAWQSWIVILLSVIGALVAKIQDPQSGFELTPVLSLVLFGVSFFIPLATNQLKAIGGPPPGTTETRTVEVTAVPPKPQ
jgi:hypothetical protein